MNGCEVPEILPALGEGEEPPREQFRLPCFVCGGEDAQCPTCDGLGQEIVVRCPNAMLDDAMVSLLEPLKLAQSGLWPLLGGSDEQSAPFLAAFRVFEDEIHRLEAEWLKRRETARR